MIEDDNKIDVEAKPNITVASSPEARIPKYCTGIGFEKNEKGMIVLSFIYQEAGNQPDQGVLIDRIIVDVEHGQKMIGALQNLLK